MIRLHRDVQLTCRDNVQWLQSFQEVRFGPRSVDRAPSPCVTGLRTGSEQTSCSQRGHRSPTFCHVCFKCAHMLQYAATFCPHFTMKADHGGNCRTSATDCRARPPPSAEAQRRLPPKGAPLGGWLRGAAPSFVRPSRYGAGVCKMSARPRR